MKEEFNKRFSIAGREVGEGCPVYIIAEAGVAHFGSIDKAFRLVDLAAAAGADAVKFQIFQVNDLFALEADEWRQRLGSRCLPYSAFDEIKAYCEKQKITFFATAHDQPSLDYLAALDVPVYKIGSGEVDNWPFMARVASHGKPVIFSTGMYTLDKVKEALRIMAEAGNRDIGVLHCVTSYPTAPAEVNLSAMHTIRNLFPGVVGYSDHTRGIHFPVAAAALGAKIIEKHISLDFNVPNAQDWKVSCDQEGLTQMVNDIRDVEAGLGDGVVKPTADELANIAWARKSLVTAVVIDGGETVTIEKLVGKRPGTGIAPADLESVLGRRTRRRLPADHVLQWEDIV